MQIIFGVVLLVLAGLGALGIYALVEIPRLLRRALPGRERPALEDAQHTPRQAGHPVPIASPRAPTGPARGAGKNEDLRRYPRELAALEEQLGASLEAVRSQRSHLDERLRVLSQKEGRQELAHRYEEDLDLLGRREAGMRRVLGLVWKARALLTLRAHLAETARGRPELPALPPVDDPKTDLVAAGGQYSMASQRVRAFLIRVRERALEVAEEVPAPPIQAEVLPESREEVEVELGRVRAVYSGWEDSLDRLADTLDYLTDRCRTRRVVQGSAPALAAAAGGEALMAEVDRALGKLKDLSDVGDRSLADLAVRNLAEDISQLERAGLEAQAEAEAAVEVARLLEQF